MSETTPIKNTITQSNLNEFKKLVRKTVFLTHDEEKFFKLIPNSFWNSIFSKNFDGNFAFARRILLNQTKEVERLDNKTTEVEKNKIFNLDKAVNLMNESIKKEIPIIYITDFDNDGSLAQSIINEYLEIDQDAAKNMKVLYAQTVNGNSARGFTIDHVELIAQTSNLDENSEFLIVTADNGINSRDEQIKILNKYPNSKIIITDHHNPDPILVTEDNEKTVVFNPHYKPTPFFERFNISGANTIGVLLKNVLEKRFTDLELITYSKNLEKITTLCKVSNLLDYVDSHPADKPEKDFIITKFLKLQPLMNINNSISKIITGEISTEAVAALEKKIPKLNTELLYDEAKRIQVQNHVAKVLLYIYKEYKAPKHDLNKINFGSTFLAEIVKSEHYLDQSNINPNYIEQLRPLIFGLNADYEKNAFLDELTTKMEDVYNNIKLSEKLMAQELRAGEVITKQKLEHSVFAYADPHILSVFNRKFLNKVYNDENPGFSVTLDSIGKNKVSGSFRSLYNISEILKNKKQLEKKLGITIDTPGHEKAAGFVIKTLDPINNPIDDKLIGEINSAINLSIDKIKKKELKSEQTHLLVDFNTLKLIDKLNIKIRGNVSNFEKFNSLMKINKDTVWTDTYTTKQYTMEDICREKKYGYVNINTDFHGGTIIVPVELIRKVVESNYEDYLSLGYMDGGVFMVDRVLKKDNAKNIISLIGDNSKTKALIDAFSTDFKDKNIVSLTREHIQDNPFFKYNDYGKLNFDLFERMVIGIIDTNKVDMMSVFDVEANGFANAKIINIGSTNYTINPNSGQTMNKTYFFDRYYHTQRGEEYLLTSDETAGLKQISPQEKEKLSLEVKKLLLIKHSEIAGDENGHVYFLPEISEKKSKSKSQHLPYTQIKNYIVNENDNTVTYNREIQATMSAYLMKEKDFKIPQEMVNLTGITQDLLNTYGKPTAVVDKEMAAFYEGKKVLFGAHNIPYDAKILRANMPEMYKKLNENLIYDSANFSRENKLAYDDIQVSFFNNVPSMPKNIFFYNNKYSDFNLTKFISDDKNGYYPDRTNRYLLEIDNADYYLVDKVEHEKIKLDVTQEDLLNNMLTDKIPANSIKYSVEKLSEQWMIHSLLLCNEKFDIKHVDLNKPEYAPIKQFENSLAFFQDNYHFDVSLANNKSGFNIHCPALTEDHSDAPSSHLHAFRLFCEEFLTINNKIQQKFADAWMYKAVLEIKDPTRLEITNDLVDLVYHQTQIPKDKIRTIFADAIEFKEKYKIDHVLQHEMHANGPWRTDSKGDVAFEDKLTLTLLAQREYNSYDHSVKEAVRIFNQMRVKAKIAFDISDRLSDDIAQDSYSFRQGILYDREAITPMIDTIKQKEDNLTNENSVQLVKFKLANDVLPQDGFVYALIKEDVKIDRKIIEEHKHKLSFILLNQQLVTSLHKVTKTSDHKAILEIIESNTPKVLEIKNELSKYYFHIEYNRKDYQMKQFIDKAKDFIESGREVTPKTKLPATDEVDVNGLHTIKYVLTNFYNEGVIVGKLDETSQETLSSFITTLNDRIESHTATRVESVMTLPVTGIKQTLDENGKENITEENFLPNMSILRIDPVDRVVNKHTEFGLITEMVYEQQQFHKNKNLTKLKP